MLPFLKRLYWSRYNGLIRVNSRGEVFVGGCKQTSERYANLWADAFEHIELPRESRSVLMLGLAGGGAIPAIRAAYPQAAITAVEYDPAMIAIANELSATAGVEVLESEALDALRLLEQRFDLILVDIFQGFVPSPRLKEPEFWETLAHRLSPQGIALVNVAGSAGYLELPRRLFARSREWRYHTNIFGAFSNH